MKTLPTSFYGLFETAESFISLVLSCPLRYAGFISVFATLLMT